jgi:hypothetical protein
MAALDTFQLDTIKRRRAELAAHLAVIDAQRHLAQFYHAELDEIEDFLAAVEEVDRHGDGPHV